MGVKLTIMTQGHTMRPALNLLFARSVCQHLRKAA